MKRKQDGVKLSTTDFFFFSPNSQILFEKILDFFRPLFSYCCWSQLATLTVTPYPFVALTEYEFPWPSMYFFTTLEPWHSWCCSLYCIARKDERLFRDHTCPDDHSKACPKHSVNLQPVLLRWVARTWRLRWSLCRLSSSFFWGVYFV